MDTIISTKVLAQHLTDPDWVIVDCQFDLANPDWGYQEYLHAHIPGAAYAHLDRDLSGEKTVSTGRHPLPKPESFVKACSSWGIDDTKQVVVYDSMGGAYAARLWWLLHDYGHDNVAVLDGGWQKWLLEGRPVKIGEEKPKPSKFSGTPGMMPVISSTELKESLQDGQQVILDARSPERFAGLVEPIDPVAGHIPGAINRFHGINLGPENVFLPPDQLKKEYLQIFQNANPQKAIVYCGSGVTSCHLILAMKIAGLPSPRLYPGSWSEWIRDPHNPIVTSNT
jgi:thiosulfate/3-mercaptopyruvate sulfurtransferase